MTQTLIAQYELVKGSRKARHEYCLNLDDKHFVQQVEGFGRGGSIRSLLVHITNTYNYWIGTYCMARPQRVNEFNSVANMRECIRLYQEIDELINNFFEQFDNNFHIALSDGRVVASPFKAFTHVITHEFHHKGQILTMSRLLGYKPIDTDVIR